MKTSIYTDKAPEPIGSYSQAIKVGNTVYLSGQIGINPETKEIDEINFSAQATQVFTNLSEVAKAAGGTLDHFVMVNIYMTDLADFDEVNEIMQQFFTVPYPARAAREVVALPKHVKIAVDAVMVIE